MLYYFLKIVVGIFTRIFYNNPLILNRENVPQNTPLIIASNHPNALCDPCSLAVFSKQRIHFLARGDVFKNKILYSIFVKHLGMVPIYRLMEGAENLHRNEETFRNTAEKLRQKKTILMFSEGICIQERRLRKLKKGTARIAFAAEESADWNLGLKIIPVGLNYNSPAEFRSDLVVCYGKPFSVSIFKDAYLKDKAIAINELTRYLEERLSELVVHIASADNDQLVTQVEEMLQNETPVNITKEEKFKLTKAIAVHINNAGNEILASKGKINAYYADLNKLNLSDRVIKFFSEKKISLAGSLLNILFLLLTLPLYIFGFVNNYIPYKSGYVLAKKLAKTIEFHATVHMYSSLFLYLVFYCLQIISVGLLFRNWYLLGWYMLLLPLSGLFTWSYYESVKQLLSIKFFISLGITKRDELMRLRREITTALKSNFNL